MSNQSSYLKANSMEFGDVIGACEKCGGVKHAGEWCPSCGDFSDSCWFQSSPTTMIEEVKE